MRTIGRGRSARAERPPIGNPAMKTLSRALGLAVVTAVLATSSGCSIIDRLFLLNTDGPHGHHASSVGGQCQDGQCQDGACQSGQCGPEGCPTGNCQPGGDCQECEGGACHPRHVGRYGGLAKHHLTPEEKAGRRARRNLIMMLTGVSILMAIVLLFGTKRPKRRG